MSRTKIEWTDATWNPVTGCAMVHEGCKNCYALTMSARLQLIGQDKYKDTTEQLVLLDDGTTAWRADWETFDKRFRQGLRWSRKFKPWPDHLGKPLEWKKPRSIFVNSMSDMFGEGVPFEYIAAVFAVMAATLRHKYVILTKRPARAIEWFRWFHAKRDVAQMGKPRHGFSEKYTTRLLLESAWIHQQVGSRIYCSPVWPLPNVAIGVSVSDQASADEFLPLLEQIPTVAPIVSVEPMLGPVDLSRLSTLAQVIIGAESGPGARPGQIEWVRALAKKVLDAQAWETSQGPPGPRSHGHPMHVSGPSLFVKQWPVCLNCIGWPSGTIRGVGRSWDCTSCRNTGQSRPSMTRKREADKTPRLDVSGYGAHSWTQPIRWPS